MAKAHNSPRTQPPEIPDKLYFRIGEVARMAGVEPYVLRFWETEFPALRPAKSRRGQRLYRRREVELALQIKSLLYDQRFTIAGARVQLRGEQGAKRAQPKLPLAPAERGHAAILAKLKTELAEIEQLLK